MNQQKAQQLSSELHLSLQKAHYMAGLNNPSISRQVFDAAYQGSGNITQSICSGLLTTGAIHGPLTEAREFLYTFEQNTEQMKRVIENLIRQGEKVPGLGNSFFKDSIDPAFQTTYDLYTKLYEFATGGDTANPLDHLSAWTNASITRFKEKPSHLFPNAAGITAAVCNLLKAVPFYENWFFISGRSKAWIESLTPEQPT